MLMHIINYLLLGVMFCFIVDMASDYARRKGVKVPPDAEWNWETRLIAMVIWPLGLIFFLRGYIKERYKKKY